MRYCVLVVPILGTALTLGNFAADVPARPAVESPVTAETALQLFQVDPGLRVELVAAEPLVQSPCAIAWDGQGRLFAAENRGYPVGPADGKPVGVIAMLSDSDRDGRMDQRVDFATGLSFPNGLLPWRGGWVVTCAPDILYLKDTDGDGSADLREVWFTGFDATKTTQLRVSHPTLGPDGWIYLTSGWAGENKVTSPKRADRAPVRFSSDSRFHPETLEIEAIDGRSQFGQSFDDWANRFICFNRVHIQHAVLSSKWLQRNPHYAFSDTVQNVPETMYSDLISGANQNPAARIFPISQNITTADSHAGQFSAACAVTIYRGNGLPANYYGDAFACDPTGNLVHRDKLIAAGATFSSRIANEGREFLASPDNWFRPVNLAVGPDGALYVCDMYRKTIEHPEYLPIEVRKRTDFESGRERGRIWRVVSTDKHSGDSDANLSAKNSTEWVKLLGHDNVWHRDTARRLLLEDKGPETFSGLIAILPNLTNGSEILELPRTATDPAAPGPHLARINALDMIFAIGGGESSMTQDKREVDQHVKQMAASWKAATSDALDKFFGRLMRATLDESPGVRHAAFRFLASIPGQGPDVSSELLYHWADDPNPQVRFQVARFFSKTGWGETMGPLATIARRDGADRWLRAVILSGLKDDANQFFEALMRETNSVPSPELIRELCRLDVNPSSALMVLTDTAAAERLFGIPIPSDQNWGWRIAGVAGLSEAIRGSGDASKLVDLTDKSFGDPPSWKAESKHFQSVMGKAEEVLWDSLQPIAVRSAALTLLLNENGAEASGIVLKLVEMDEVPELQQAAARGLVQLSDGQSIESLLHPDRWKKFSPMLRGTVLNSLLSQPARAEILLTALEDGSISPSEISRSQRDRLLKLRDGAMRNRAAKLFAHAGGDRMKAFEASKAALALRGSSQSGREVFAKHCASCHRLEQVGFSVGPDLFGMRNQPKEAILLHLVVPNHEVNPGFTGYEIETRDGRVLTGVIASETASSVSLRQAQGIEEALLRQNIQSLRAGSLSLMPDELEKTMTHQEMADLLSFLKGE